MILTFRTSPWCPQNLLMNLSFLVGLHPMILLLRFQLSHMFGFHSFFLNVAVLFEFLLSVTEMTQTCGCRCGKMVWITQVWKSMHQGISMKKPCSVLHHLETSFRLFQKLLYSCKNYMNLALEHLSKLHFIFRVKTPCFQQPDILRVQFYAMKFYGKSRNWHVIFHL